MPIPSALQVTIAHLKTVEAVQDAGAGARVLTGTPSSRSAPWIRVALIGDPPTDGGVPDHHIEAHMQIDVFAGEAANSALAVDDLSIAIRDALSKMHKAEHDGAVVTGSESFRSGPYSGEDEPAMEYFRVAATVWMHG